MQAVYGLRLSSDDFPVLTNTKLPRKNGLLIPIVIGKGSNLDPNCNQTVIEEAGRYLRLPFKCNIAFASDIYESIPVSSVFDVKAKYVDGEPFCEIMRKDISNVIKKQMSTSEGTVGLQVFLTDDLKDTVIKSDVVHLPLSPAFYLNTNEIKLSDSNPKESVMAIGTATQLRNLQVFL